MSTPINLASEATKQEWQTEIEFQQALTRQADAEARHAMPIILYMLASVLVGIMFGVIIIAWLIGSQW